MTASPWKETTELEQATSKAEKLDKARYGLAILATISLLAIQKAAESKFGVDMSDRGMPLDMLTKVIKRNVGILNFNVLFHGMDPAEFDIDKEIHNIHLPMFTSQDGRKCARFPDKEFKDSLIEAMAEALPGLKNMLERVLT